MSDTPCVDGCGQDAATIERLSAALIEVVAERDRLHRLVTEAALETYTPDGSERFVAEFHRVLAERDRLAREIGDLCGQLGATEGSPVTDRIAARLGKEAGRMSHHREPLVPRDVPHPDDQEDQ